MADPYAKIYPQTFLRTIEALLLRPDCQEEKQTSLRSTHASYQVGQGKGRTVRRFMRAFPPARALSTARFFLCAGDWGQERMYDAITESLPRLHSSYDAEAVGVPGTGCGELSLPSVAQGFHRCINPKFEYR
jgi:hypothetical protein